MPSVELESLGRWLVLARKIRDLSQKDLALRAAVSQARVSDIERGQALPTLPQLLRLARALALPVQWFLNGSVTPGAELSDIALQLQSLKVVDLFVPDAAVPGAFRPTEEVLALAVGGNQPNPRIIEAIPAVLAWNLWSPPRLREFCRPMWGRTSIRLAWLSDIALTIHRTTGFPGGCPQFGKLEAFVGNVARSERPLKDDDLGYPGEEQGLPPVSKRWKIGYDAPLTAFVERATRLNDLVTQRRSSEFPATRPDDE